MQPFFSRYGNMDVVLANMDTLIKQTKTVLRIYRKLKWALMERQSDMCSLLAEAGWGDHDTGITYLTSFLPETDLNMFEAQICRLMENKLLMAFIDKSILHLKQYPEHGTVYFDIVCLQYLSQRSHREKEILEKLCIERSTFYRRKKEALFLLGLCLFGLLPKRDDWQEYEQFSMYTACETRTPNR